ncbi:hypothetical protein LTR78_001670 [Recurvomyces mirabilis]|uniref:AB hydrolase-1 domain-containing protein n=1 Tax=Recurvomyces mirabilis TaxID=574656 RepID=A0AAE0WV27_9PEZI|nr:hypothetical protein LTR78_001670 [Recurvomyces mirabilis]KAK5151760.1 hypothetical protein LTS14_008892 [Recurvomyces mirabilis]
MSPSSPLTPTRPTKSIWIADQTAQGTSAVLNDEMLGNEPHWFDHSRDILCMVDTFRLSMTKPIIGIGHSMGASQLVAAAHFHPGLLDALVMVDPPIFMTRSPSTKAMLRYCFRKPEAYAPRQAAEEATRRSPFFKTWDKQVLQRFLETVWGDGPTVTVPDDNSTKPTTPLHMQVRGLIKPNPDHITVAQPVDEDQRYTHPDIQPTAPVTWPFYSPHSQVAYRFLSTLRPPALFLLGEGSQLCDAEELVDRTNATGTAPGGSGGITAGRVKSVTIPGGHFLPMTNVAGTAEGTSRWLAEQIGQCQKREEAFKQRWEVKSLAEKQRLDGRVQEQLKNWDGRPSVKPNQVEALIRGRLRGLCRSAVRLLTAIHDPSRFTFHGNRDRY